MNRRGAPARRATATPVSSTRYSRAMIAAMRSTPASMPPAMIARAELRDDRAVADLADEAVGQRALDAVAGRDEELAILDGDQEEDAVVLVAIAGLPGLGEADGALGHRIGLRGRQRHDRDLGAGLLLQLLDAGA